MRRPVTCPAEDASAEQRGGTKGLEFDEEVEDSLSLTTAEGERPVRRDGLHRLAVVVVHFELFLLIDRVEGLFTDNDPFIKHELAQGLAKVRAFANRLGDDVTGAFEGVLDSSHFPFGVDKCGGGFGRWLAGRLLRPALGPDPFQTPAR